MTPDEWAEVFNAGAASHSLAGNQLVNALYAMETACKKIAERNKEPRLKEDRFMGKPVSGLTYEEAIRFRQWLASSDRKWISENTLRVISRIIAEGPEPDRPESIKIIPPTIIEGGQEHGRP